MRSTRYQVPVCTYFCARLLAFAKVDCPLSALMFTPSANLTRTADQNATSPTSTQHSAQHSAQHRATVDSSIQAALRNINCLVASSHGPFLSAPLCMLYLIVEYFLARAKRVASATRRAEPLYVPQNTKKT